MTQMEGGRYESDVVEIDLGEILSLLWHRAWMIAVCAAAAAVAAFCISSFVVTEQFQSTTKVYILNKDNNSAITYSDVQLGSQLTKDYAQIIKSRDVLEQVIKNCLPEESYEAFSKRISVEIPTDTRIIAITVTDEDPVRAQYLANEIRKVASLSIESIMDIQAVNVVDEANLPMSPSSPNVRTWTLAGFLMGAFACAAVVIVHFMLDDTIKTSDDVEKYLGLSTLGMIPEREDADREKQKRWIPMHRGGAEGNKGHTSGNGPVAGSGPAADSGCAAGGGPVAGGGRMGSGGAAARGGSPGNNDTGGGRIDMMDMDEEAR